MTAPPLATAPSEREHAVLDSLTTHARPLLLEHFSRDSCIASTRIALDVLAYFAIPAVPVPLFVVVLNAEAAAMLEGGSSLEEVHEACGRIAAQAPGGPWTIGIGAAAPTAAPTGWQGHLVAALPHLDVVVDLSIDQASRPHKGLTLTPYWSHVDPAWCTDPTARTLLRSPEGARILLDRGSVTDPDGYTRSPNWRRKVGAGRSPFKEITGQVIRRVRADLDG